MKLNDIFLNSVSRPIEGVIKADDESHLYAELDEYVLTDEVAKRLELFLDAYTDYQGANGVWISGFYGSGKSHLLKMLALLLENRSVDGTTAQDLFLPKIPKTDALLRAKFNKAIAIPSKSILFNIDQKADIISKNQTDALLTVFVKVFNEMCGYFGKQGYIAQFERDLDGRAQLQPFKQAYETLANKPWERGRETALLEAGNISRAYAQVTGEDIELTKGILDKYRGQYTLSIEDFSNQVKAWLDQKPDGFRLNFFVDEVGQYIAENTKLMTNLQTVAESLATKCHGRAWIIVTAQEDMEAVLGEMGTRESNDFSKIQARFANRLKLTSANVDEVIQKRLLTKNDGGVSVLTTLYQQQANNFKTLFDFSDGGQHYKNFQDSDHFISSYPFVPYQFPLFQASIRRLSEHSAFEGKASSVGERSMLGVFREVAIAINEQPVGQLATFDRMFEGIRGALKGGVHAAITTAENHLDDPYAVRVLKALFLVKYVKEFKASLRNISILMLEQFNEDIPTHQKRVESALNLLEQQTYIQRNGDVYEYLTNEEKDIEQEIKNTEIESSDLVSELEKLIFEGVIRQRKIRYTNGQDYSYARKMDDRLLSRESELTIHVVTPLSDLFEDIPTQRMQTAGLAELRIVLPADSRFMQDLTLHRQTEKYIRQNSSTQQDTIRRILDSKSFQNRERLGKLEERIKQLLTRAHLIVSGNDLDINGGDPQARITKAFHQLIESSYTNLRMLRDTVYSETDIARYLQHSEDSLIQTDATSLTEAEQEMLAFVQSNAKTGVRTSVKNLLERFQRRPYGWYFAAILCNLALLIARGKIEIRQDSNVLSGDTLERLLRNTTSHPTLILEPQEEFTASQLRSLKNFYNDFFHTPARANDAKALVQETIDEIKKLELMLTDLHGQKAQYPFLIALENPLAELHDLATKNVAWFMTELPRETGRLLDLKEDTIDPVVQFMRSPQKTIYDTARSLVTEHADNLAYLPPTEVDPVKALLDDPAPFRGNRLQQAKTQVDNLQLGITAQLATETATAIQRLDELQARIETAEEFGTISTAQQTALLAPFAQLRERLKTQQHIAMVRDQLRNFEDIGFTQVLDQLDRLIREASALPAASVESTVVNDVDPNAVASDTSPTSAPTVASASIATSSTSTSEMTSAPAPQTVTARSITVPTDKLWLSNEADLDEYVEQLRQAWLNEIRAGRRIQI